jgi:hypothetical protein
MSDSQVMCLYGGDVESILKKYASWLEEEEQRYLLLVQEESPLHFLFNHPKIKFLSPGANEEMRKKILWELAFLTISYEFQGNDCEKAAFAEIEQCRLGIHLVASDYRDLGTRILSNYLSNFAKVHQAKKAADLFGCFKEVPAIICGAGPSLENNIETLRKWENRALIFAGGSALNVLSRFSILPHFSASIDPKPPLERFLQQTAFEVPFFYQPRVSQELLNLVHGLKVWIADSGGYPLDGFLHQSLGIDCPPFDAGWNVSTFLVALATKMGCSPIIFAGMELSTASNRVYAAGVEEKVGEEFIETLDVDGKSVLTKHDWLIAGQWLEEFTRNHPQTEFVNATRGGLPLQGIFRTELASALKNTAFRMWDLHGLVHSTLEGLPRICEEKENLRIVDSLKKSFQKCVESIEKLLVLYEKSYPLLPSENGEGALLEVELEEEPAYRTFLNPLWEVWSPMILREEPDASPYLHRLLFFRRILNGKI